MDTFECINTKLDVRDRTHIENNSSDNSQKDLVVFSDLFWVIDTRSNPCRIDKTNTAILSSNEGYFVFLINHVSYHMI